jgi:hypothetical protein
VKRLNDLGGNNPNAFKLYNFVDNHDVERIYTKLNNKAHFAPVHILLYTLPGIPSIYYGSEFGIEGRKEKFSDASLRPAINLEDYKDALENNQCTKIVSALGHLRQKSKALSYGDYKELALTNRQYAYSRNYGGECVVVTVNNDDSDFVMTLPVSGADKYVGVLSGHHVDVVNGTICVNVKANYGDVWLPVRDGDDDIKPLDPVTIETVPVVDTTLKIDDESGLVTETVVTEDIKVAETPTNEDTVDTATAKPEDIPNDSDAKYDEAFNKGRIAGLQEAIIAIMEKNGCVTDQMKRDVYNNVYHDSLITWIKSFR